MNFSYGDRLFFQSEAGYWLGIIECDCFVFIVNEPIKTVLEGMHYLNIQKVRWSGYMMKMDGFVRYVTLQYRLRCS